MKNNIGLKLVLTIEKSDLTDSIVNYRYASIYRFYVYILQCSDDSYYVGVTNSLSRRLEEHNSRFNEGSYTSSRLPVNLVYFEEFKYILKAIAREKQLKGWSKKKKEALINGNLQELKMLAQCDNNSANSFQYYKKLLEKLSEKSSNSLSD